MKIKTASYFSASIVLVLAFFAFVMAFFGFLPHARATDASAEAGQRLVTIYDRGEERSVITSKKTLRDVFVEIGLAIDKNDIVEPGLDDELVGKDYRVNIYRARPVVIEDDKHQVLIMSAHQTPRQIAEQAGITLHDEDQAELTQSTDLLTDGASLRLVISRATPVKLTLYGKTETIYTRAATVGELLTQKGITLAANDTLSLPRERALTPNLKLEIWRNGKQTITKEEAIDFSVKQIQDADREPGYRQVKTAGVKGKKMVTYEIIMKNGKQKSKRVIQTVVVEKAKRQVEVVGAKFTYTGGPLSSKQIAFLGNCESGMTATRNSGNGFYGAFQFMPSTWRTVAPAPYNAGLPHEAPLGAQKQAVQNLLSRSSIFTQFPGCARQMRAAGLI